MDEEVLDGYEFDPVPMKPVRFIDLPDGTSIVFEGKELSENRQIGDGLPDREFLMTRQHIIDLLEQILATEGHTFKFKSIELHKSFIDLATEQIGHVWKDYYTPKRSDSKGSTE